MAAIFISHSSADKEAASEMKLWLEAQGHTSLFLDFNPEAGIKGGSNWEQTLYRQLRQSQAVIARRLTGWLPNGALQSWCRLVSEVRPIFPVKVQACQAGGVFGDIQHIDLTVQPEEGYQTE